MPAWLIPALKAVLPHIGTIVSAAAPAFTRKSTDATASQATLQQQITELQAAASANDEHIKNLAAQVKTAVEALEAGVSLAGNRHRQLLVLGVTATVLSVAAVGTALFVLLAR